MKIIELRAENFKRLSAVTIRPDGSLVQITGKNGHGKTSVLDSLWAAFAGKDVCPVVPIRKGQERASVTVDLGELIVTRTFKRDGEADYTTEIKVENGEGARYPQPQKMLDALLGALSFDPLEFARMKPADQFNALRKFVPGVDFTAIAWADRGDRDKRTELTRSMKTWRGAADSIVIEEGTPEEPIDESALVTALEEAGSVNAELEQRIANRRRVGDQIEAHTRKAAEIRTRIAELRAQADKLEEIAVGEDDSAKALNKRLSEAEELPPAVDTGQIRARIEEARAVNANVRKLGERRDHRKKADELEAQVKALTEKIEQRQLDKEKAIAAAAMPVEGLGFGDESILLNGLPFGQGSDAEQLRTSVAIAMALNPKLRVIRVRDGSLLDEDAMKLLGDVATEKDFQVWIERVDSSGTVGFVLEDGHLKAAAEPEPAPAPKKGKGK